MDKKQTSAEWTMAEEAYQRNEKLLAFHTRNNDWQRVMLDKWSLLVWGQKGGN